MNADDIDSADQCQDDNVQPEMPCNAESIDSDEDENSILTESNTGDDDESAEDGNESKPESLIAELNSRMKANLENAEGSSEPSRSRIQRRQKFISPGSSRRNSKEDFSELVESFPNKKSLAASPRLLKRESDNQIQNLVDHKNNESDTLEDKRTHLDVTGRSSPSRFTSDEITKESAISNASSRMVPQDQQTRVGISRHANGIDKDSIV